jgi:hypothetical protein
VLYRPVGQYELDRIAESGYRAFPPRFPEQPLFYPVLNREYAEQIAREWNVNDPQSGHCGYVLQFRVCAEYLSRYEVHTVGSSRHREYWIPAEDLDEFNCNLMGEIEVLVCFR